MPTPPVDPGYFDKVNYVIEAWSKPCRAPWYIYVETMGPAALEAFITLVSFGWDDVARGYFRPKDIGLRRSSKGKPRKGRAFPKIPELGEKIGGSLPGADQQKGKKWSEGGKFLWRVDGVIQRVLFWWLVADVTIDFAFNWTSVLYETKWCEDDLNSFSYRSDGVGRVTPGDTWWNAVVTVQDYEVPLPSWDTLRGRSGPTGCQVAFAMNMTSKGGQPPLQGTQTRIVEDGTNKIFAEGKEHDVSGTGQGNVVIFGQVPPNTRFRAQLKGSGTPFFVYGDGVITATAC